MQFKYLIRCSRQHIIWNEWRKKERAETANRQLRGRVLGGISALAKQGRLKDAEEIIKKGL